jgi:hypothetical protein
MWASWVHRVANGESRIMRVAAKRIVRAFDQARLIFGIGCDNRRLAA